MRIADIAPEAAAEIAEIAAPIEEDRWSEVKARKPVGPKQTPMAKHLDSLKRKAARKSKSP